MARLAEERVIAMSAELDSALASLTAEKKARCADAAANANWPERVSAELKKAADFYAEALAELPRRVAAAEQLVAQLDAQLAAAKNAGVSATLIPILEEERKTRAEEATAIRQFADRVNGEFKKGAAAICGSPG